MKNITFVFLLSIMVISCAQTEEKVTTQIIVKDSVVYIKEHTVKILTEKEKRDSVISSLHNNINVKQASLPDIIKRLEKSRNVANRPIELAQYLETSAMIIKSADTRYMWNEQGSCNVGIVAQLVTGLTPLEIESFTVKYPLPDRKYNGDWTWSGAVSQYCTITGQSKIEIINKIMAVGMDREDFYHLEYLSNKEILKKANLNQDKVDYSNEDNLVKYMEAWATMIKEYNNLHPPKKKKTKKKKKDKTNDGDDEINPITIPKNDDEELGEGQAE